MILNKNIADARACRTMSLNELKLLSNTRLRTIIRHAYKTTVFYKNLMDKAGVKPDDIKGTDDLSLLPSVSKKEIIAHSQDIISSLFFEEDCLIKTTSRSPGKSLKVLLEADSARNILSAQYRGLELNGFGPGKKLAHSLQIPENFDLFRHIHIETGMPFEETRKRILEFKPDTLAISPSYAIGLGKVLSDDDIKKIGIESISLHSEVLFPQDRSDIERKFKCRTYNTYSSVETGSIAGMCDNSNMHVFNDNIVMEIIDSQGNPTLPGERGEIVLTSLTNFSMPFIRFRIGDFSYFTEEQLCSCGLPFPIIGPIEGRKDDSFRLENGKKVPAWKIYEAIEKPLEEFGMDKRVLSDFYLVQESTTNAILYYVKGPDFHENQLKKLQMGIENLFGMDLNIDIDETRNIGRMKTVKRKYIHCELNSKGF